MAEVDWAVVVFRVVGGMIVGGVIFFPLALTFWRYRDQRRQRDMDALVTVVSRPPALTERVPGPAAMTRAIRHAYQKGWLELDQARVAVQKQAPSTDAEALDFLSRS